MHDADDVEKRDANAEWIVVVIIIVSLYALRIGLPSASWRERQEGEEEQCETHGGCGEHLVCARMRRKGDCEHQRRMNVRWHAVPIGRKEHVRTSGHGFPSGSTGTSSFFRTGADHGYFFTRPHSIGRPKFFCTKIFRVIARRGETHIHTGSCMSRVSH